MRDTIGVGIPWAIAIFNTRLPHLSNISSSLELADRRSIVVSHTFKQSSAMNSFPRPTGGRMNENLCLNLGSLWNSNEQLNCGLLERLNGCSPEETAIDQEMSAVAPYSSKLKLSAPIH